MRFTSLCLLALASANAVDIEITMDWDDWKLLSSVDGEPLSLEEAWIKFALEMGLHRLDDPSPDGILHGSLWDLYEIMEERLQYFTVAYEYVKEHNAQYLRGETSFRASLTSFADLSPAELDTYTVKDDMLGKPDDYELRPDARQPTILEDESEELDDDAIRRRLMNGTFAPGVDWRLEGQPILHQGDCGSCWAYAAATVAHSRVMHWLIKAGYELDSWGMQYVLSRVPSTQEMVDCVTSSYGCNGGWGFTAAEHIEKYGWADEQTYPYESFDWDNSKPIRNECRRDERPRYVDPGMMIAHYAPADGEAMLERHVKKGPLTVSFHVAYDFFLYRDGIYRTDNSECHPWTTKKIPGCTNDCDWYRGGHAVALMGFKNGCIGNDCGEYWILQNSWGADYVDNGFFYMYKGEDTCQLETRGPWSWVTVVGDEDREFTYSRDERERWGWDTSFRKSVNSTDAPVNATAAPIVLTAAPTVTPTAASTTDAGNWTDSPIATEWPVVPNEDNTTDTFRPTPEPTEAVISTTVPTPSSTPAPTYGAKPITAVPTIVSTPRPTSAPTPAPTHSAKPSTALPTIVSVKRGEKESSDSDVEEASGMSTSMVILITITILISAAVVFYSCWTPFGKRHSMVVLEEHTV